MKVYLDDDPKYRPTPEGWVRAYTTTQAIALLRQGGVTHLSLDHDLGDERAVGNGYKVLLWLEEEVYYGRMVPPAVMLVHSANPSARPRMEAAIESIRRHAGRLPRK